MKTVRSSTQQEVQPFLQFRRDLFLAAILVALLVTALRKVVIFEEKIEVLVGVVRRLIRNFEVLFGSSNSCLLANMFVNKSKDLYFFNLEGQSDT